MRATKGRRSTEVNVSGLRFGLVVFLEGKFGSVGYLSIFFLLLTTKLGDSKPYQTRCHDLMGLLVIDMTSHKVVPLSGGTHNVSSLK